jgi:glucan endo-1,3-alpha-glucosidase
MLYATLWPVVVLYALVADAAVISGPRYKPKVARDNATPTAHPVDKRLLFLQSPAQYSSSVSSVSAAQASQSAAYLAQAQSAETGRNYGWTAVGCIRDSPTRTLNGMMISWDNMTLPICMNSCFSKGYTYGGVQWGRECWCDNQIRSGVWVGTPPNSYIKSGDTYGTLVPYSECQTYPCAGDKSTACGNNWRNNVFMVCDRSSPLINDAMR